MIAAWARHLAVTMSLAAAPAALAHSWYEWECCAGNDCAPIPHEAVRAGKGGYAVTIQPGEHPLVKDKPLSAFVAYADARPSQDGQPHACIVGGALKCLYIQQGGV